MAICGGRINNWTGSLGGEGIGYAVGDQVLITNPTPGGTVAIFVVLALDPISIGGTGVALSGAITFGTGYLIQNGVSTTALTGVGTGFMIDIADVSPIVPCPNALPSQSPLAGRLQLFDDGAGEYIASFPVSTRLGAGANSVPFMLPSPISISKRGLVTITITNVQPTNTSILQHLALIFAVPKTCRPTEKQKEL